MDDMKKMMKRCLQMACNAVTDAHLEAIGEDRMMTVAELEEIMVDTLIANGVTIPVRCKDCKHWMAEEKERCEALKSTPYGLCLKHRGLPLAGYHEYRNQDDFCSYGERRTDERKAD